MKIYLVINRTDGKQSITASEELANNYAKWAHHMRGKTIEVWEGELKTQGKNFNTWCVLNNKKEFKRQIEEAD